jgi:raffinose/stachyose/melibiose transport system permease protein
LSDTALGLDASRRADGSPRKAGGNRPPSHDRDRRKRWIAAAFIAPALAMYAAFVLVPLGMSVFYSLLRWDGIGRWRFVGLKNYLIVITDPDLLQVIGNAFNLILYFTLIPIALGLAVASVIRGHMSGTFGTITRTVLFLPQVIPLVAAGIAWSWMFASTGLVNQLLTAVGLGSLARGWLGDFTFALPAVGMIGAWVLLGLCTMLLVTGIAKIDTGIYEAAELDGANRWQELIYITIPALRQEIGVCVTVTVIAALASFDIVYIATAGGPGISTMVPGLEIYRLAFAHRQVGLASALAIVLMVLVLACVLPIQWFARPKR